MVTKLHEVISRNVLIKPLSYQTARATIRCLALIIFFFQNILENEKYTRAIVVEIGGGYY